MRVVTGSDNGVVKVIGVETKNVEFQIGVPMKDKIVTSLAWLSQFDDQEETQVLISYANEKTKTSVVTYWNLTDNSERELIKVEGKICSMTFLPEQTNTKQIFGKLAVCTVGGLLNIYSLDKSLVIGNTTTTNNEPQTTTTTTTATTAPPNEVKLLEPTTTIKDLPKPIAKLCFAPGKEWTTFAFGGHENELQVWDLEEKKCIWKAKNVKNDRLNLRVEVWITDITFMPNDNNRIAISSGLGRVRIYDIKVQRRALIDVAIGKNPLNSVCVSPDARYFFTCDTKGTVLKYDLKQRQNVGTFRGFNGSVRSVQHHIKLPILAAASIDRFMNVYRSDSRADIAKIYMKERQTCMLFSNQGEVKVPEKEEEKTQKKGKVENKLTEEEMSKAEQQPDTISQLNLDDLEDEKFNLENEDGEGEGFFEDGDLEFDEGDLEFDEEDLEPQPVKTTKQVTAQPKQQHQQQQQQTQRKQKPRVEKAVPVIPIRESEKEKRGRETEQKNKETHARKRKQAEMAGDSDEELLSNPRFAWKGGKPSIKKSRKR